ncbi:MAG TPA: discoidin domain-containing protein, partial [Chitinophaga sp.]
FAKGAGHGATYQDKYGNWWHVSTVAICVKNNFERRIGIWPAGFDKDDLLFCNTAYGDYPHYMPNAATDPSKSLFTGWMLLNYNKPVQVSSTYGGYTPNKAVDEDIKTYWCAATATKGEWLQSDLGAVSTVHAIQINYADQDATIMGKQPGLYHQYKLYSSTDGKTWQVLTDKSRNQTDVPHDYIALSKPIQTRYIRLENIHMPTGKFAISGLRVFGYGKGQTPDTVQEFIALRGDSERRNAWLKWKNVDNATGYTIYTGIAPDKLYTSVMVYGANEYYFRAMDKDKPYYFCIEAFNENGIGKRTAVIKAE